MTKQAPSPSVDAAPIAVYAAGSLREVFTEIARDHQARTGQPVALTFGASGLLRERIEKGEGAQVFASADTQHPQRLAAAGGWQSPTVFVRNSLCALTQANVSTSPEGLLATLLDPAIRVGTSTPKADPSGDYAWELFRKADRLRPGAYATLDAKALKLTGGQDSPKAPAGRGTYAWVMDEGQADVFLTYCTNAVAAQQEVPRLKVVALPPALQVGAAYGLTVRQGAPAAAQAFAQALLAPPAQRTLARYGFAAP
jgi:molybdenum ABC transporter molybdate-binding protein